MANVNVDTLRLESDGKRIIELSKQYNILIDDIFDRIDVGIRNGWSGNGAANYRSNLKLDKEIFKKLSAHMNQYGNELIFHANSIQGKVRKWERE